jgi:SAM-dependent methyltransferase
VTVGDAYGALLRDAFAGRRPYELVERDDGYIAVGRFDYLAPRRRWLAVERRAFRHLHGRVLDVGCAAGRLGVELASRGQDVVGIDVSEGAVALAAERGLSAHLLRFEDIDDRFGAFDTVAMFGNNFGLFGTAARAPKLLRKLRKIVPPGGRIVATSLDPAATDDPSHLAYQAHNRTRGKLPGQLRLRVRYLDLATPWFDYLLVAPSEMAELAEDGGWRCSTFVRDDGPVYVGVLERL